MKRERDLITALLEGLRPHELARTGVHPQYGLMRFTGPDDSATGFIADQIVVPDSVSDSSSHLLTTLVSTRWQVGAAPVAEAARKVSRTGIGRGRVRRPCPVLASWACAVTPESCHQADSAGHPSRQRPCCDESDRFARYDHPGHCATSSHRYRTGKPWRFVTRISTRTSAKCRTRFRRPQGGGSTRRGTGHCSETVNYAFRSQSRCKPKNSQRPAAQYSWCWKPAQ